ncbi:MAG: hypothetical protein IJI36_19305 [Kiritimatiellae bacterium]|nr:hypothetical protein [Kiritimatiellia bacterium]
MKRIVIILAAVAAIVTCADICRNGPPRKVTAGTTSTVFTKSQKRFFENRRVCVSRDTESVPGSVITTWYRNGRPDTKGPAVVTNVLHSITGTVQNNPLQDRIAALNGRVTELLERATSAEARAARADRLKAWLEEQRDKQVTSAMKKIYQAIIDRLEEVN